MLNVSNFLSRATCELPPQMATAPRKVPHGSISNADLQLQELASMTDSSAAGQHFGDPSDAGAVRSSMRRDEFNWKSLRVIGDTTLSHLGTLGVGELYLTSNVPHKQSDWERAYSLGGKKESDCTPEEAKQLRDIRRAAVHNHVSNLRFLCKELRQGRSVVRVDLDPHRTTAECYEWLEKQSRLLGVSGMPRVRHAGSSTTGSVDTSTFRLTDETGSYHFRVLRPATGCDDVMDQYGALLDFCEEIEGAGGQDVTIVNCRQGLSRSLALAVLLKFLDGNRGGGSALRNVADVLRALDATTSELMCKRFGTETAVNSLDDNFVGMIAHVFAPTPAYMAGLEVKSEQVERFLGRTHGGSSTNGTEEAAPDILRRRIGEYRQSIAERLLNMLGRQPAGEDRKVGRGAGEQWTGMPASQSVPDAGSPDSGAAGGLPSETGTAQDFGAWKRE